MYVPIFWLSMLCGGVPGQLCRARGCSVLMCCWCLESLSAATAAIFGAQSEVQACVCG